MTIQFPLAVIDFEASSFSDERSYPVEVGVAVAPAAGSAILVWSSLIRPTAEWIRTGDWSAKSAKVHGISLQELESGGSPEETAHALNRIAALVPRFWCDGGEYDVHWHRRLFEAARVNPAFQPWDISGLFVLDRRMHNGFAEAVAATAAPHRAGADAARICAALRCAKGYLPAETEVFTNVVSFREALIDGGATVILED